MGWLQKFFERRLPKGIRLDADTYWEVSPPEDVTAFFHHLHELMPARAVLYLEGVSIGTSVAKRLTELQCEPQAQVALGTLWPKPRCFHIPLTEQNLREIAALYESNAPPEICDHLHVYAENSVLLEWHDALYDEPFLVDERISKQQLQKFCRAIRSSFKKTPSSESCS